MNTQTYRRLDTAEKKSQAFLILIHMMGMIRKEVLCVYCLVTSTLDCKGPSLREMKSFWNSVTRIYSNWDN